MHARQKEDEIHILLKIQTSALKLYNRLKGGDSTMLHNKALTHRVTSRNRSP